MCVVGRSGVGDRFIAAGVQVGGPVRQQLELRDLETDLVED